MGSMNLSTTTAIPSSSSTFRSSSESMVSAITSSGSSSMMSSKSGELECFPATVKLSIIGGKLELVLRPTMLFPSSRAQRISEAAAERDTVLVTGADSST